MGYLTLHPPRLYALPFFSSLLEPDYAIAYFARSWAYSSKGDLDTAIQDLNKVLELDPNNAVGYVVLGAVCIDKGDLDTAMQDLNKALELDPDYAEAYTTRGVAYAKKGRLDLAIGDYNKSLGLKPDKAAYVNRGIAWLHKSEWEKARADLLTARNMGMDIVAYFPDIHGSVEDFEQKNSVKLPEDIRELLSIEEAPPLDSGKSSLLEMFRRIR